MPSRHMLQNEQVRDLPCKTESGMGYTISNSRDGFCLILPYKRRVPFTEILNKNFFPFSGLSSREY